MTNLLIEYRVMHLYDKKDRAALLDDLIAAYPDLRPLFVEIDAAFITFEEQEYAVSEVNDLKVFCDDLEYQVASGDREIAKLNDRIYELERICDGMVEQTDD